MKMQNNISTNILRDSNKIIDYVVTPNTKEIYDRIFNRNYSSNKSFNLIGNYGTGKSTFLWACEKNLNSDINFFSIDSSVNKTNPHEFIKIVGEEESLVTLFSQYLGLRGRTNSRRIIETLDNKTHKLKGSRLIIFIDEFGKILEYNSKQTKSVDLYFLQQLAEWVNDDNHNAILVTTLHQSFLTYGKSISDTEKIEWEKVKGRFVDLVFNEPVEQLLFFASKKLEKHELAEKDKQSFEPLIDLIKKSKLVSFNDILNDELIKALYPLDWLSANILVNALQKYGQNERSLFSFLSDNSKLSIHNNSESYYYVPKVYDYIINALSTEINSSENTHRAQWLTTFRSLERSELFFEDDFIIVSNIIKTISLVNLFTKIGGCFDDEFIINYFKLTTGIDVTETLKKLYKSGIIRFYKHSNKINFLEGTDIDIEQELIDISRELNNDINYTEELKSIVDLNVVYVKKHSIEKGTKRFFEYKIINSLDDIFSSKNEIDGYINIIFENLTLDQIIIDSRNFKDNVFVQINNKETIKDGILKVLKFKKIIEKHTSDKNAIKLLNEELIHVINKLRREVEENIFSDLNIWIHDGIQIKINSKKQLFRLLTDVCHKVYPKTPFFDNELINRNVLSSPINSAKKYLIARMLEFSSNENLNFEEKKFPPEKAIYISLIKETGLHIKDENLNQYKFSNPPKDSKLYELWNTCEEFLYTTTSSKRSINELFEILKSPPYKLKNGFIDIWIPIFLIIKQEDYALFYHDDTFIPFLSTDTLDLLHRKPVDFFVKSYDVSGLNLNVLESYKELVGIDGDKSTQSTFISIYGNFLRFVRGLNEYALLTKNLSENTIKFRDAILNSKDPETALFESIPISLGFGKISTSNDVKLLESYTSQVKIAILELRNVYSELLNRIEKTLCETFGCINKTFPEYKEEIKELTKSIDSNTLIPKQKIYFTRLNSFLDDRNSWLKSVADVALGKQIEKMIDHEENIMMRTINSLSEALIKSAEIVEFNNSTNEGKMYLFKLYKANGEYIENKRVIKNNSKNYLEMYSSINEMLNKLSVDEKKDLLIELVSNELNSNE